MNINVSPRKTPKQARALATVDAIVEAAARILVEVGYEKLNTNEVARRAGVSVGSLYQYFPNKQSLLAELHFRHATLVSAPIFEALRNSRGKPLREVIRHIIQANVASHSEDHELHRVISEQSHTLPQRAWQVEMDKEASRLVRSFLTEHKSEIHIESIDLTIYLLSQIVESCIHSAVLMAPKALRNGSLARELERMLYLYLTIEEKTQLRLEDAPNKSRLARHGNAGGATAMPCVIVASQSIPLSTRTRKPILIRRILKP
jgi:AcrR family transcriptional regulator